MWKYRVPRLLGNNRWRGVYYCGGVQLVPFFEICSTGPIFENNNIWSSDHCTVWKKISSRKEPRNDYHLVDFSLQYGLRLHLVLGTLFRHRRRPLWHVQCQEPEEPWAWNWSWGGTRPGAAGRHVRVCRTEEARIWTPIAHHLPSRDQNSKENVIFSETTASANCWLKDNIQIVALSGLCFGNILVKALQLFASYIFLHNI